MMGLSTSGIISLGCALVAGRKRVPSPAAGKTALQTFFVMSPLTRKSLSSRNKRYHDRRLRDRLLLSRQLLQQRLQTHQHLLGLLLLQRELQHARGCELAAGLSGNETRQPLGLDGSIRRKANAYRLAASLDLGHADALRKQLQSGIVEQVAHCRRRSAVAIAQFSRHIRELRFRLDSGHP